MNLSADGVIRILAALTLVATSEVFGATGTIFYNTSKGSPEKLVRAIGADGSNDREVILAVPSPALPEVSRDGRALLVTSGGPLASVMLSQNVFHIDLSTGVTRPISHYNDTTSDGIITFTNDAGMSDFNTYSYYTTHLPNHKAFSPTGDRVALLDLSAVSGREPGGVRLAALQSPVLEVFPVQQNFPIGDRLFTGAERTTVNQAGDGLDWHPTREELLGAFRADIPSFGNLGESKTEGTVVMVFATSGASPHLRMLTQPTGRSYYDFNFFYLISETEQDYAPAISRDGTKVAYVRNTLGADTRIGSDIRLLRSAIRIINYDGTGDRELVGFGNNLWITKVAWSPDDSELVFDLAPRLVVNGLEFQLGDLARSEIHIVRTSDATIRLLAAAPAAYPSWSPLGFAPAGGGVNQNPVIAEIAAKSIAQGQELRFSVHASDQDLPAQKLSYSLLADAPSGASIDLDSGVFSWTPSAEQGTGTFNVSVVVSDNATPPGSAQRTFQIIVERDGGINRAPQMASIPNQTVEQGRTLTFTAVATDADGQPLTFSLEPGAPVGATIDPNTGVFHWIPSLAQVPGTFIVSLSVRDNAQPPLTDTKNVLITVTQRMEPTRPAIKSEISTLPSGLIKLRVTGGNPNDVVRIEAARELGNWMPIAILVKTGEEIDFVDPERNEFEARYYRAQVIQF